ncbi:hypothetical protein [Fusobacterium sp. SYSU M8D902]
MKLKYSNGLIFVRGKLKKNNEFIQIEKTFSSREELLEFWSLI